MEGAFPDAGAIRVLLEHLETHPETGFAGITRRFDLTGDVDLGARVHRVSRHDVAAPAWFYEDSELAQLRSDYHEAQSRNDEAEADRIKAEVRAQIATAEKVDRDALLEFVRPRHKGTLVTTRKDGRPQMSPVSCGVDEEGRIVVSTYPERAKAVNLRRDPRVSILVHSDDWNDPYVQVDGTAEVLDMPEALEGLVEYYRCIAGEHSRLNAG